MGVNSNTHGTLYLIGERDRVSGSLSSYIKVGIVSGDRVVEKRAKEHQTGNPRELVVLDTILSPFVSRLETQLLKEFVQRKISDGEWLWLGDVGFDSLLSRAKALNAQLEEHEAAIRFRPEAKTPGQLPSLEPSPEIIEMGSRRSELEGQISVLKAEDKKITSELKLVHGRLREIESPAAMPLTARVYKSTTTFSTNLLKQARPDLYERFPKVTVTYQFVFEQGPTELPVSETLALFGLAAFEEIIVGTRTDVKLQEILQESQLAFQSALSRLEWEKDLLEGALLYLGRDHNGIQKILSWTEGQRKGFDVERFLAEMPEESKQFFVSKEQRVSESLPKYAVNHESKIDEGLDSQ